MSQEELEEATDIILKTLSESSLPNYTKVELMINLRKFFEHYNENIRLLQKLEKRLK